MTESGWPEEMRVAIVADAERGRAIAEILRAGTASEGGDSALSMGEKALVVEVLREASQLRYSLGPGRWDVVVVDPARVLQDAALVPILAADTNARAGPGPRIVLYADVAAAALRGTHAIAMRGIACSILVRGVDDAHLAREVVSTCVLGPTTLRLLQEVRDGLVVLPPRLRAAWDSAILGTSSGNVKAIALRAGASRRTIERWHRAADLPMPGELLRRIHASRQSDANGYCGYVECANTETG